MTQLLNSFAAGYDAACWLALALGVCATAWCLLCGDDDEGMPA